jgi:hypothetical protein
VNPIYAYTLHTCNKEPQENMLILRDLLSKHLYLLSEQSSVVSFSLDLGFSKFPFIFTKNSRAIEAKISDFFLNAFPGSSISVTIDNW